MTANLLPGGVPVGGRIHNQYEVRGYIGGGSFGAVYEVWDENLEELVALKVLMNQSGQPWRNEAAAMAALRGPFLLPVYNAAIDSGVPFIVTPLMRNQTLNNRLVSTGVPVAQAVRWVQQACSGVSRIHARNLLHNDIKPANLFLDEQDRVLVGDLGEAAVMNSTGHGRFAGSPPTLAPEVAAARGVVGALPASVRSDVYSLGATLYWLIAGDVLNPALHTHVGDTCPLIATHTPEPLWDVAPHVTQGLNRVVMRAVAPNPADRYATPTQLEAALGNVPRPDRVWNRATTCTGHAACFDGEHKKAATVKVCAFPAPTGKRLTIETRFASGRTAKTPRTVTRAHFMPSLRAAMRAVT